MPKRIKPGRCHKTWDEHDGYRDTGKTETENLGNGRVKVWKVYRCQCGARKSLMR